MTRNQRLLISVFDAQEAREAILGGARVIDCEDPAGALGDISPRSVTAVADAVVGYKRDLEVQISTNIGENQLYSSGMTKAAPCSGLTTKSLARHRKRIGVRGRDGNRRPSYGANFYQTYKDYPAFIVSIAGNHDCQPDDPQDGPVNPDKFPLDGWVKNFMADDPGQLGSLKTGAGRTKMDLPNVYWTFITQRNEFWDGSDGN